MDARKPHLRLIRPSSTSGRPFPTVGRRANRPSALVEDVGIELGDDAGTVFTASGAHAGGTGTEWAATQMFTPTVTGQRLTLLFTTQGSVHQVLVNLKPTPSE